MNSGSNNDSNTELENNSETDSGATPYFKYILKYSSGYDGEHEIYFTTKKNHLFELRNSLEQSFANFLNYKIYGLHVDIDYDFGSHI